MSSSKVKAAKDVLVIGAGAVGLATARALAIQGHSVVVAESGSYIGGGVSSRNSEVLHAGIYYAENSLKAQMCVKGHKMMIDFLSKHHVPYEICGKLIVATTEDQVPALHDMARKGHTNGVHGLTMISQSAAQQMEPALSCVAALLSPNTGIVDSHSYMLALQGDLGRHGGVVALNSRVVGGRISKSADKPHIVRIATHTFAGTGGAVDEKEEEGEEELPFDIVVNSGSLHATEIAQSFHDDEGNPAFRVPSAYFAKGHYCSLMTPNPFSHLIYPVPTDAWLGIHLTLDLDGKARFGPDMQWVDGPADALNYNTPEEIMSDFEESVRKYYPDLPHDSLIPSYSGIRPRIYGPGEPAADFRVDGFSVHGVPGWINFFGVESPGLTSSMALGEYAAALVRD
jgi:L-2-hydroxyglutarate oxidase LhgO